MGVEDYIYALNMGFGPGNCMYALDIGFMPDGCMK